MKTYFIIFIFFTLICCKKTIYVEDIKERPAQKTEDPIEDAPKPVGVMSTMPDCYNKTDNVVHLFLDANPERDGRTEKLIKLNDLYHEDYPEKWSNTNYELEFTKLGYQKIPFDKPKLPFFLAILKNQYPEDEGTFECVPNYRDIFIFKKKNKIIAVLKICFECSKSHMIDNSNYTCAFESGKLIAIKKCAGSIEDLPRSSNQ